MDNERAFALRNLAISLNAQKDLTWMIETLHEPLGVTDPVALVITVRLYPAKVKSHGKAKK